MKESRTNAASSPLMAVSSHCARVRSVTFRLLAGKWPAHIEESSEVMGACCRGRLAKSKCHSWWRKGDVSG